MNTVGIFAFFQNCTETHYQQIRGLLRSLYHILPDLSDIVVSYMNTEVECRGAAAKLVSKGIRGLSMSVDRSPGLIKTALVMLYQCYGITPPKYLSHPSVRELEQRRALNRSKTGGLNLFQPNFIVSSSGLRLFPFELVFELAISVVRYSWLVIPKDELKALSVDTVRVVVVPLLDVLKLLGQDEKIRATSPIANWNPVSTRRLCLEHLEALIRRFAPLRIQHPSFANFAELRAIVPYDVLGIELKIMDRSQGQAAQSQDDSSTVSLPAQTWPGPRG